MGVMGASERDALSESEKAGLKNSQNARDRSGSARDCILSHRRHNGPSGSGGESFPTRWVFALGISPAKNRRRTFASVTACRMMVRIVIVYTGFGYKGRNVVNVRSADVIIVLGGATGTLNEFTIAYDEGKVIGILEGSGGVADHVKEIIQFCQKPTRGLVVFDKDPEKLVERCLDALSRA